MEIFVVLLFGVFVYFKGRRDGYNRARREINNVFGRKNRE